MTISAPSARCLPDPRRAQRRTGRAARMHRGRHSWAGGCRAALWGSWYRQIAAGGRTATVAASAQAFQLLSGQCFPTDRSCPYAPLLDLLHAFLAPLSATHITTVLGASARALFPLLPEQIQHLPELASLPPLSPLEPEQEQRRLFAALSEVFMRATSLSTGAAGGRRYPLERREHAGVPPLLRAQDGRSRLLVVLTYRSDEADSAATLLAGAARPRAAEAGNRPGAVDQDQYRDHARDHLTGVGVLCPRGCSMLSMT